MATPTSSPSTAFLRLSAFLLLGSLMLCDVGRVSGQDCQGQLRDLIMQCAVFVAKQTPAMDPSPECCDKVKAADGPCVCKYVTEEVEGLADMAKVVRVASFCGKPLAPGSQCGSYKVPPTS